MRSKLLPIIVLVIILLFLCAPSSPTDAQTEQTPYHGVPIQVPLQTIQAEGFDNGGEGVAYHDTESTNLGGSSYRSGEGVDISSTSDTGGGYHVGYVEAGEWLEYTIDVAQTGTYRFEARVAHRDGGGEFHVEIDGQDITGRLKVPQTGAFTSYQTIQRQVSLTQGVHTMRVSMDTLGTGAINDIGDFNYFRFTSDATGLSGDANGDGRVDGVDFSIWLNNYGKVAPTQAPTTSPVPTTTTGPTNTPIPTTTPSGPTPTPPDNAEHIIFSESNEDFSNPERGFMDQSQIFPDEPFSSSKISRDQSSDSLVWVYLRLDNYRDPRDDIGVWLSDYQGIPLQPIGSGVGLDTIQAMFDEARSKGLKIVLLPTYNFGGGISSWTPNPDEAVPDAPIELVQQHVSQMASILQQNADVLATVKAGFVGYWGEWHSTKYLHLYRKEVVDALLNALPTNRTVLLRRPMFKEVLYGGPINQNQAFSGSDISRTGHYSLGLLDPGNQYKSSTIQEPKIRSLYCDGASNEIQCWKDFAAQESRYTPVGGESNQFSENYDCSNALQELDFLNWSFLNNGFYGPVLDTWSSQGCMPEIRRKLGYRFVIDEAFIPASVQAGGTLTLDIRLRNVGFANMYNPRPVYIVLRSNGNRYNIQVSGVDPRGWEEGGVRQLSSVVTIPSSVPPGTYELGLWLPDQAQNLRDDPRYSVRFANQGVWDASTGINILTDNFQVD